MTPRLVGGKVHGAIAVGCARWSLAEKPDEESAVASIRAARDVGVTLFDTARAYSPPGQGGHSERLLARALGRDLLSDEVSVVTKGGHWHELDGSFPIDARPDTLRDHVDASLDALGVEAIDLYLLHWPDPLVPLIESMGALAELRDAGKIRAIGLSNADVKDINVLPRELDIAAVQNRYAFIDGVVDPVLDRSEALDLSYLAYSPLGGPDGASQAGVLSDLLTEVAREHSATEQQVAIAWLLAQGPHVVCVTGAGNPRTIIASVDAAKLELSAADLARLDQARVRLESA